jgi:hypothetical protein
MPQVLNIRHLPGFKERRPIIPPGAVYIGRAADIGCWRASGRTRSVSQEADRAAVIAEYERWLGLQRHLIDALPEPAGRDLVCWCAPLSCHGDVLLRLPAPEKPPLHLRFVTRANWGFVAGGAAEGKCQPKTDQHPAAKANHNPA